MTGQPELNRLLADLGRAAPAGFAVGLHIRFAAPLITVQSYDPDWLEVYTSNAYALRDPMVAWAFSQDKPGATRWSAITIPDTFDIWGQAASYGLKYGVAVTCGPNDSRTIVGASRSDREFTDEEMAHIKDLVVQMHEVSKPPTELTKAQVQALRCIADGDRHAAAAAKIGISESALKARLTSARTRLMARTTSEAIQRAKELRLL